MARNRTTRKNSHGNRERRQAEAIERQAESDERSVEERMDLLNERGHGHCNEVARLYEKKRKEREL